MYDYVSLRFELPAQDAVGEAAIGASPAFEHCVERVDKQGWPVVKANYKNLRIEYKPGQHHGFVRGSLHAFAHGSNVGAFTATQVAAACSELAAALCLPANAFEVCRLEVGVNLALESSPSEFLGSLLSHKNKPFTALSPPAGVTHPLQWEACYGNYRPKFYDKGLYEAKQGRPLRSGQHLMRFEMKYTRAATMLEHSGRARLTLADLPAPDVWAAFSASLLKNWNLVNRRPIMDYQSLSFDDGLLLQSADNLAFWAAMKAHTSPSTYKRKRARLRELLADAAAKAGPHPYDTLVSMQVEALNDAPTPKGKAHI
jgi:hypothetical protein